MQQGSCGSCTSTQRSCGNCGRTGHLQHTTAESHITACFFLLLLFSFLYLSVLHLILVEEFSHLATAANNSRVSHDGIFLFVLFLFIFLSQYFIYSLQEFFVNRHLQWTTAQSHLTAFRNIFQCFIHPLCEIWVTRHLQ